MWETGKIGNVEVYAQRSNGICYEVYISDKLELIVRDSNQQSTRYLRFEKETARNYQNVFYDDAEIEKLVNSIPELDQLPKDITSKLQSVKKKEKPQENPQPDQS